MTTKPTIDGVSRYDISGFGGGMIEVSDGSFVAFEDFDAAQATIAQLEKDLNLCWGDRRKDRDEIRELKARIAELESGRGEPVAYLFVGGPVGEGRTGRWANINGACPPNWKPEDVTITPLYTAPPAPVAVALNDAWLIEIARIAAVNSTHRYGYMPATTDGALDWLPHRWVIEAMRGAIEKSFPARTGPVCAACQDYGVIGWTNGLEQGEAPCQDCQATGYAHSNGLPVPGTCDTCKGAGVVDDGEITHSEGGIPYENGPVKCVKDCPDCGPAPAPSAEPITVEAVAIVRECEEEGLCLEWLLEGGIAAVEVPGTLLLVAHGTLTDDSGHGYVYPARSQQDDE